MPTHIVKYNADNNELTAYCDDDKTKTEIGPAKWNTTTKQLEIHCGGNVYPVKWNNIEKRFEARNVSADCCCEYTDDCTGCYGTNQTPKYMQLVVSGINDCGNGLCNWANGTFILESRSFCEYYWNVGDFEIKLDLSGPGLSMWDGTNNDWCFYRNLPGGCSTSYADLDSVLYCSHANYEGEDGLASWASYPEGC